MAQGTLRRFMEIKEFQNIMRELYAHPGNSSPAPFKSNALQSPLKSHDRSKYTAAQRVFCLPGILK